MQAENYLVCRYILIDIDIVAVELNHLTVAESIKRLAYRIAACSQIFGVSTDNLEASSSRSTLWDLIFFWFIQTSLSLGTNGEGKFPPSLSSTLREGQLSNGTSLGGSTTVSLTGLRKRSRDSYNLSRILLQTTVPSKKLRNRSCDSCNISSRILIYSCMVSRLNWREGLKPKYRG